MSIWQMFYRRNRLVLVRAAAIAAVAICGLLALAPMPGSGANRGANAVLPPSAFAALLSPQRLETAAFVAEYLTAFH